MPRKITRRLTLWVDRDIVGSDTEELVERYEVAADAHNRNVTSGRYPDAGFDIMTPNNDACIENAGYVVNGQHTQLKLKTGVRCVMEHFEYGIDVNCDIEETNSYAESFYLFPRSSISKSNLRLANNVGIIDSGYRGQLIAVFDVLPTSRNGQEEEPVQNIQTGDIAVPYSRFIQVCCGDLRPFVVNVELLESDKAGNLIASTSRGEGGFGSTGM